MLFVIHALDNPEMYQKRMEVRSEHVSRLQELQARGKIFLAGPLKNPDTGAANGVVGSLIILDLESLEETREWIENDPYVLHGVYSSYSIHPFQSNFQPVV